MGKKSCGKVAAVLKAIKLPAWRSCRHSWHISLATRKSSLPEAELKESLGNKAEDYGYGQSLMERLSRQLNGQLQEKVIDRLPVLRFTIQYRMHPEICLFPSNYVYDRALKTDGCVGHLFVNDYLTSSQQMLRKKKWTNECGRMNLNVDEGSTLSWIFQNPEVQWCVGCALQMLLESSSQQPQPEGPVVRDGETCTCSAE
ncbi:uncharacterized protein LOC132591440 [Zootoca vivipara]|uniref:uncharacterized protein LOC132591440 n=1 Tax=Zootoca vivipara TaxID=8524 RepID=UPI00293BAC96|nr:uncharacterized protein LOC132591440 [Zootoca vivipara]